MRLLIFTIFFQFNLVFAGVIQVPEDCLNRVSPCLIRAEDKAHQFKLGEHKISLTKEAILKIEFNANHLNLELLDGHVSLVTGEKLDKKFTVNSHPITAGRWIAKRTPKKFDILSLNDYRLSEYQTKKGTAKLLLLRSDFINKKDFVGFTKYFFEKNSEYKSFLAFEAPKWKAEFDRQNNSQAKVLMRTIAAEKEKARIEDKKKALEAAKAKKVRSDFFYRTFNR